MIESFEAVKILEVNETFTVTGTLVFKFKIPDNINYFKCDTGPIKYFDGLTMFCQKVLIRYFHENNVIFIPCAVTINYVDENPIWTFYPRSKKK